MQRLRRLLRRGDAGQVSGADAAPADAAAPPEPGIFFVRGHPRSGTNWCGNLLNLHPKILVVGEWHFEAIRKAVDRFCHYEWHVGHAEPVRGIVERHFREMVRESIRSQAVHKPGATWIGDRTPREVRFLVPGAPHFLVVRDGRDVMVSFCFHQMATKGPEISRPAFWNVLKDDVAAFKADPAYFQEHPERLFAHEPWVRHVARSWAARVREDLEAIDQARTGRADGRILVVRYERMHADPDGTRREMYEFLGLDPDEAEPISLESCTAPGVQTEDPAAFYRKGTVGDWRTYAGDAFLRIFEEEAGEQLAALGYADQPEAATP